MVFFERRLHMKQLSHKISSMKTSSVRILTEYADEAEKAGKKIYRLNIGQPDLLTPYEYYRNIRNFNQPTVAYMPSNGLPELIESVERFYIESGIGINKNNIAITTGGSEAVLFSILTLTNPGDEFIVFEPYYSNYNTIFTITGAKPVAVTTYADNGFHFGKNELIAALTDKTKAILVTNPGNPTGTVLTKNEVRMIADVAKEYDLYIIADEVYREIIFDGRDVTSFGFLNDIYDRLIIIDSVSKRFNACGARIGAVITKNQEIYASISKLCQSRLSVSTIEQHAAVGLFSAAHRQISQVRDEFQLRRDIVFQALRIIPGVICRKPEGAFYVICKLPVNDANEFLIWLLKDFDINGETVMAAPADGFYLTEGLGKDEIRIAYILETTKLQRAMDILAVGIREYNKK